MSFAVCLQPCGLLCKPYGLSNDKSVIIFLAVCRIGTKQVIGMSNTSEDIGAVRVDDDRELVLLSQQGDHDAFEQLVVRHRKKMVNIAFRITGSYEDACDVAQDAFVSAYKEIKRFELRSRFSTWLYTITVNLSKNRLKQITAARDRHEVSIHAEEGAVGIDPPSSEPSALEALEKRDVRQAVQDCIARLEEDFRVVVVLRDIQGFAYNEIGEMLKMAGGTVKSRLFRAREMLKKCLKGRLGDL
jgi:RNA polymerase sigma-70 factor, ECF subfamily